MEEHLDPEYRQHDDIAGEPVVFEWRDLPRTHNSSNFSTRIIFMATFIETDWDQKRNEEVCKQIQVPYQPVQNYFWKDAGLSPGSGDEEEWYGTLSYKPDRENGIQQHKK